MRKLTAFIVDDKRLIRESLIKTIAWERCGFQVAGEAGDGLEAEEAIRRTRPDVVITDIRMPGRDGLSLAERIQDFLPDTKVIVITGFDRFEYAQKSLRVGAVDIILKPIKNETLEDALILAAERIRERAASAKSILSAPSASATSELPAGHLTKAVIRYIEENMADEISLFSLSETFRISPSHLSRVFKREMGETFLRYLTRRRVERARGLLDDPALQISEIAYACGFSSPVRFTKTFKELTGRTPSACRRKFPLEEDKNRS